MEEQNGQWYSTVASVQNPAGSLVREVDGINLPFPRVQHSAVSVLGFECTTVPGQDHVSVCLFLCVFSTQNNTEPRLGDTGKSDMMIGVYFQ